MNLVDIFIKEIHSEQEKETAKGNKYIEADITVSDPGGTKRIIETFVPTSWKVAKEHMRYLG